MEARFCGNCGAAIPRPRPERGGLGRIFAFVVLGLGTLAAALWWGNVTYFPWSLLGLVFVVPGALFVLATMPRFERFRPILVGLGCLVPIAMIGALGVFLAWLFYAFRDFD